MVTREVILNLPAGLAGEAEAAGLLAPGAIKRLIREEMRRRQVDQLFTVTDRLAAQPEPLTPAEVEEEVEAARREKHGRPASGG